MNIHRRHLTESQRAMAAAKLANITRADAGRIGGKSRVEATANLQLLDEPREAPKQTTAEAARLLNVSPRTVATAKKVQDTAPQEVVAAVQTGHISLTLHGAVRQSRSVCWRYTYEKPVECKN